MSLYGRIFAAVYDRGMEGTERAGLARRRHDLLQHATGSVVEIGAGTGLNLDHYPPAAQSLDLTEPEPPMAERLRRRAGVLGRKAEVTLAPAELLPFADDSFDTAVSTLALCTVDSPERALAELRRVLRPGGTLLFLEHVRSGGAAAGALAGPPCAALAPGRAGCNCNRPTEELSAGPDSHRQVEHDRLPKAPPLVRPADRRPRARSLTPTNEQGGDPSCAFCAIVRGEADAHIVLEDESTRRLPRQPPAVPRPHLLIPREHVETLPDLPDDLLDALFATRGCWPRAVVEAFGAEGSFVALNNRVSQSVPHLHVHVVPRRRKDGLRGFFWPRTGYRDEAHALESRDALRVRPSPVDLGEQHKRGAECHGR